MKLFTPAAGKDVAISVAVFGVAAAKTATKKLYHARRRRKQSAQAKVLIISQNSELRMQKPETSNQ